MYRKSATYLIRSRLCSSKVCRNYAAGVIIDDYRCASTSRIGDLQAVNGWWRKWSAGITPWVNWARNWTVASDLTLGELEATLGIDYINDSKRSTSTKLLPAEKDIGGLLSEMYKKQYKSQLGRNVYLKVWWLARASGNSTHESNMQVKIMYLIRLSSSKMSPIIAMSRRLV